MATPKRLSVCSLICLTIGLSSCSSPPAIKVYESIPVAGGLVRKQDNELIPYRFSRGYFCASKKDLETLFFLIKLKGRTDAPYSDNY